MESETILEAETSFTIEDGQVKLILQIGEIALSMSPEAAQTLGVLLIDGSARTTIGQRIYDQHADPVYARQALEEFGRLIEEDEDTIIE